MISTATELMIPYAIPGDGPKNVQAKKVTTATNSTTGTSHEATTSASFWIAARLRCASATRRTMRARSVSAPTCSARMTNVPFPLTVPPVTSSPTVLLTGIGSPVNIDSST